MADGPALALQAALVTRMKANAGLTALVGARVYGKIPHSSSLTFPFVQIGQKVVVALRLSGDCRHYVVTFSVEGHSRWVAGEVEAQRIARAIELALDGAPLSVSGFVLSWCSYVTDTVSLGPDGETYIAIVAFEASLEPT